MSSITGIQTPMELNPEFLQAFKSGARGIPQTVLDKCLPKSEEHFGITNLGARVAWWFGQGFEEKPYEKHGAFTNLAAHEVTAQLLLKAFPDHKLIQDYAKVVGKALVEALNYAQTHRGMALRDMNIRHLTNSIDFFGGKCGEMPLINKEDPKELTQLRKINELLKHGFKGRVELRGDRELSFRASMDPEQSAKIMRIVREVLKERVSKGELNEQFLEEVNLF